MIFPTTAAGQDDYLATQGGNRIGTIDLWYECGLLTPDRLRELLVEWWSTGEGHSGIGTGRLVRLFRAAGFVTDTPGVAPPDRPLTVYRGIATGRGKRRLSWTLDRGKAEWFARRYAAIFGSGAVLEAEVDPCHVLGILHGRGESEVVVNPRGLRELREVDRFGPQERDPARPVTVPLAVPAPPLR